MNIEVEQAMFASSDRGRMKGYQLVAKSEGIDRDISQELCRWAPTQTLTQDPKDWTINYFPVSDDLVAVTRTVLGGPEYSSRGTAEVVTMILVLRDDQFAKYSCNAMAVAENAMLMGHLRIPLDMSRHHLPSATLPPQPIVDPPDCGECQGGDHYNELLDEVVDLVNESRRVAVVGLENPLYAVNSLVPRLAAGQRRSFSFTTGLAPAVRRPFQAHFLPTASPAIQRALTSQQIVCLSGESALCGA